MTVADPNGRPDPVLRAERIVKQYPGTTALQDVTFNVYPGKINVLIGENGAGKSTLMKILAGVEQPTSGRLVLGGESLALSSAREGLDHGIGIIYQELNLFPNLSVSENIFVGQEKRSKVGTVLHRQQDQEASALLERLEQSIDPRTLVEALRIGQQQLVEIARALAEEVSVLIMDEPTSALSDAETEVLLRINGELTAQGVAIVYISHKLDECLQIGDYFTVLRDGRFVAEAPAAEVSLDWIVEKMSGRSADRMFLKAARTVGDPVLEAEQVSLPRPHGGGFLVRDVTFTVRAGEIVGLYGLMGAGRTELLECLFGMQPAATGRIRIDGRPVEGLRLDERIEAGLALVPEDRQRLGLVQNLSVAQNITLASLPRIAGRLALSRAKERSAVQQLVEALAIKIASAEQPITTLSGGNQQKVVIARSLLSQPKVLMMDEPTRGIDVAAKSDIFSIIKELAEEGLGILFVSSELKEVVAMADRALVMARGRLTGAYEGETLTPQHLADASIVVSPTEAPSPHAA